MYTSAGALVDVTGGAVVVVVEVAAVVAATRAGVGLGGPSGAAVGEGGGLPPPQDTASTTMANNGIQVLHLPTLLFLPSKGAPLGTPKNSSMCLACLTAVEVGVSSTIKSGGALGVICLFWRLLEGVLCGR